MALQCSLRLLERNQTIGPFVLMALRLMTDAARFLIAKAALQWKLEEGDYRDDITAIVIYLDELAVAQPGESGEVPDGSAEEGK